MTREEKEHRLEKLTEMALDLADNLIARLECQGADTQEAAETYTVLRTDYMALCGAEGCDYGKPDF